MPLPPVIRPKNENGVISERVSPLTPASLGQRWPQYLPWAAVGVALLLGFAFGILVMRHRHTTEKTVAAVNGVVINESDLFGRLQIAAGQPVMHKLVEEQLQLQFSAKKGVSPTDAEVDARYLQISKDQRFLPALAASGMSIQDYKHSLRVKLAQANVLTQGITVSDAEIRDFYNKQSDPRNPQAQFYKPDTITFRVIATAKLPVAQKALADLGQNTPFELVAAQYSLDPSTDNGGQISPLQRGRSPLSQNPALEATLFSMKVGQTSAPLNFNRQWWIFHCEDKALGQALPFESIKDEAKLGAEIFKGNNVNGAAIRAEFQDFQRSSTLQAFWPQYRQAVTGH
jgi:parvulin-like peptidyl-prolyl isomerase